MGFPGRLNEKKNTPYGLYLIVAMVIGAIVWGICDVMKVLRKPLTEQQKQEIKANQMPGYVSKKADRFKDNLNQIMHGDPLKPVPERTYGGRAVIYGTPPSGKESGAEATDYYSGR